MTCPKCKGKGIIKDPFAGYVNCQECSPNLQVCSVCGDETEPFEMNLHADCEEELEPTGEVYYMENSEEC